MTQENTSSQASSPDWTFKTEEELLAEQQALTLQQPTEDSFIISQYEHPVMNLTPNLVVTFHKDGKDIGQLDWSTGKMSFHGNADDSAQAFLSALKIYIDSYISGRVNNIKFEIDTYLELFK